jgi:hypothetical protein
MTGHWVAAKGWGQGSVAEYPAVAGIEAKLLRADEHLEALRQFFQDHFTNEPCDLRADIYVDPKPGVHIHGRIQPPSIHGAAIIGDVIQNLRMALEYLICRLVERECSGRLTADELRDVLGSTYFPMLTKVPTLNKAGIPGALSVAPYVSAAALQIIEEVQPFVLGKDADIHPLARLAAMSNQDKHQAIHATPMRADSIHEVTAVVPSTGRFVFDKWLDEGVELKLVADGDVTVNGTLTVRVAFEDSPPFANRSPVFHRLLEIRQYVRDDVCARLVPLIL